MAQEYILPVKIDKGRGFPLVLLHGLGNTHESWHFVLEHLDYTKWRVIVLDLLGFGDAPKPAISYTAKDHADAVIATLRALDISEAVFAGHSMGSLVSIEIAHVYPTFVKRQVLLGCPLYQKKPRGAWWQQITRAEGIYFALFDTVKKMPEEVQAGSDVVNVAIPFVKGFEVTRETWPAYRKSLEHTIMQQESYKHAAALKIPTLFVNGLLDLFIIRSVTNRVVRGNRRFLSIKRVLGPHELTPQQGKVVAGVINHQDTELNR